MTYTCQAVKPDGTVCGYTWTPRPKSLEQGRTKPVCCPKCLSRDWDKKGD